MHLHSKGSRLRCRIKFRQWLPASEITYELLRLGPDTTGLAGELREILPDTTDDLQW
jgi:hypothetical protein